MTKITKQKWWTRMLPTSMGKCRRKNTELAGLSEAIRCILVHLLYFMIEHNLASILFWLIRNTPLDLAGGKRQSSFSPEGGKRTAILGSSGSPVNPILSGAGSLGGPVKAGAIAGTPPIGADFLPVKRPAQPLADTNPASSKAQDLLPMKISDR